MPELRTARENARRLCEVELVAQASRMLHSGSCGTRLVWVLIVGRCRAEHSRLAFFIAGLCPIWPLGQRTLTGTGPFSPLVGQRLCAVGAATGWGSGAVRSAASKRLRATAATGVVQGLRFVGAFG